MALPAQASVLHLPGVRLHYEVRGAGPLLVVIPGGPQDAGVFADLARHLADRYTVVAYDPRGNSRSVLDGEPLDQRVEQHADDAAQLIDALDAGPAHVFGTSGGAQIALDLSARYPDKVRTVVAHEPPCVMMLEDPSEALTHGRDVYDTYRRDGVEAAMQKFFADNALDGGGQPDDAFDDEARPDVAAEPAAPSPEELETFERVSGNFEYFLAHGMIPLSTYEPDVGTLRDDARVTVAIGELSAGLPIEEMGLALAKRLDREPVLFPGDHVGFGAHAEAFAAALHGVLDRR
ncbi:alpha/beta fold hydrolase [Phytoactinopolyspora halotolerans]|uniref:Alpha/beta hydrolase n=1 Tax=Phytoactinopolyspora halotolerans TaxID=1981512 RepID=A0A6L9S031_9ACTN|nr:alpha/beta hydrolase [Phytoactinopolyspora halotolerans]NED98595.1 alpha/beta hydrolase [Phytoactinopolyspora halotolerans]